MTNAPIPPDAVVDDTCPIATNDPERLRCTEIRGGNEHADFEVTAPGLDVFVYARPFEDETDGGDLHFLSSCASGRITRLFLTDVSGHGNAVADLARDLRTLLRRNMNFIDQSRFVEQVSDRFGEVSASGQFATGIFATFFEPKNEMTLCNAGHPPPLVYRAKRKAWSFLLPEVDDGTTPSNVPLGILHASSYVTSTVPLDADDLVVCYSDAVNESQDTNGKMLGMEGLLAMAGDFPAEQPDRVIPHLIARLVERSGGQLPADDLTVLLVRGTERAARTRDTLLAPFRVAAGAIGNMLS